MKRNVRFFSMILALFCVVSMIPVMTVSAADVPEGYIAIGSYDDLATKLTINDAGTQYVLESNVILTGNIDYTNQKHIQINLNGYTLDGNGYAMYGIKFTNSSGNMSAFAAGGSNNVVKNLTIGQPGNEIDITGSKEGQSSGVFLGYLGASTNTYTFENVTVYAKVKTTKQTIGGFVGNIAGGTLNLTNCNFYGSVTDTKGNPGGAFVGKTSGAAVVNITNCNNYGNVTKAGGHASGFVGENLCTSLTITNCSNYGEITNNSTSGRVGSFIGNAAGQDQTSHTVTITDGYNYGKVTNSGDTGGIVGYVDQKSAVTIQRTVNAGDCSGATIGGFVGNVNGNTTTLTIENSLNIGKITGSGKAAGVFCWKGANGSVVTLENTVNMGSVHSNGTSTDTKTNGAAGLVYKFSDNTNLDCCGSFATVTAASGKVGAIKALYDSVTISNGLYYSEISNSLDSSELTSKFAPNGKKSLIEGLAWTNELLGETFGKLLLNTQGTGAVFAAPVFAGVQEHKTAAGNIRLVATLGNSLNYSAVGFDVELVGGNAITVECNSVYQKLLSTDAQGFEEEVTATELYGTYLFALAIENVPTTETVTLKITPYGKDLDGTTVYSGDSYNIVITDGNVVDISACA